VKDKTVYEGKETVYWKKESRTNEEIRIMKCLVWSVALYAA